MKIINLMTAAVALIAVSPGVAPAQQGSLQEARQEVVAQSGSAASDAFVSVSFGAVMMQVPVSLAVQLCPGADADDIAARFIDTGEVACAIPHEAYTSHSDDADAATE